jgi:hypothetical protein
MATILNSSLSFDSVASTIEIVLSLDAMPSSSVYKATLTDVSGISDPQVSWVDDSVNKTITFTLYTWLTSVNEIESVRIELPYEASGNSLVALLDNTGAVLSSSTSPMYRLDFALAPFNGVYNIEYPSTVFFSDGSQANFSYFDYLCVFYASNVLNTFISDKVPVRFEVTSGNNLLVLELESGSTSRFEIVEIKEPSRVNLQLLQEFDFEDYSSDFYPSVDFIDHNENSEEVVVLSYSLSLYGPVGQGLVEKISLTEYNFLYRDDQYLPELLRFYFKNLETLTFSKNADDSYSLVSHSTPQLPQALDLNPTNGYVWDYEIVPTITVWTGSNNTSGPMSTTAPYPFKITVQFDPYKMQWEYFTVDYDSVEFFFPGATPEEDETIRFFNVNGNYVLEGTTPSDGVWDEKPLTGGDLIQTTSNFLNSKGDAIITIRSSAPMDPIFKWWRMPFSNLANDISYRIPTSVQMSPDGMKAVLTISPGPKGKFFIENGDFTKEYEVIELGEANAEIQFAGGKIQVYANDAKYGFKNDYSMLKLFKIVNGEPEAAPTAIFTGARNNFYYLNQQGQTIQLGSTHYNFQLYGIYAGKNFNKAEYKFVFSDLSFLTPYSLKTGFSDILLYDPNGSTDEYYTGDEFYEAAGN